MTLPNIDKSLLALPGVKFVHIRPRALVRPMLGLPYIHSSKTDITRAFRAERARLNPSPVPTLHTSPKPWNCRCVICETSTFVPQPGGVQP